MCKEPVTLGGGIIITYGFFDDLLLEANAPLSNHFLYHLTSIDCESNLLSIII